MTENEAGHVCFHADHLTGFKHTDNSSSDHLAVLGNDPPPRLRRTSRESGSGGLLNCGVTFDTKGPQLSQQKQEVGM